MTEQQRSIVDELRALQDARKLEDPRITAMVADVRIIRTELRGLNSIGNLALGNSREAVQAVSELINRVIALESLVAAQAETIAEQAATIEAGTKRLDTASAYLKSKGMK